MRRLLIIGCGDIGSRVATTLIGRWRIFALTRTPQHAVGLRARGIVPVIGDLDHPETLVRLAGLAQDIVHLVPPPGSGTRDTRSLNLSRALTRGGSLPQRLVYISTSGVYGNCDGMLVDETRPPRPETARALRRLHAETLLREWGAQAGVQVSVLRVPGIYAHERLPLARIQAGTPALRARDDPFTNHIHADDLARAVIATLIRGRSGRAYNATDDAAMKMGDWFDLVAQRHGLPPPPRVSWDEAQRLLPENLLSFMRESRRLANRRLKSELRLRLRYASVQEGLRGPAPNGA
jgi:nucleoside-diphosphate-sugar epimerase